MAFYPPVPQNSRMPAPVFFQYVDAEALRCIEHERTRLEMQLTEKSFRETALVQWHAQPGQGYFTHTSNGMPIQITEFVFDTVYQVSFAPLFFQKAVIQLVVNKTPVFLTCEELLNNKKFLAILLKNFGSKIKPLRSDAKLASLLRNIILTQMEPRYFPYFSGWEKAEEVWRFRVFPGFNTKMRQDYFYFSYEHIPTVLPVATSLVVQQMLSSFEAIRSPALRALLFFWQHLAFLQTPLRSSGIQISQILYLSGSSFIVGDYLKKLLSFGGDASLPLNSDPEDFINVLATQKDRTTVICQTSSSSTATKNADALSLAMERGTIKLSRRGWESIPVNIATLPVVLGNKNSMFALKEACISIELEGQDFDTTDCKNFLERGRFSVEYWFQFAATFEKLYSLWDRIVKEQSVVAREFVVQNELPRAAVDLLGAILAIEQFLHKIYADDESTWLAENIDWQPLLINLLSTSDSHGTATGFSDMFVQTTGQMLRKGELSFSPTDCSRTSGNLQGTVYFDADFLYFDKLAFERVCSVGLCPCNATKKALREQGYLVGPFTNQNSYSHRLRSYTVYGEAITIPVFRFKRYLFEKTGEPSVITKEDVWTTS